MLHMLFMHKRTHAIHLHMKMGEKRLKDIDLEKKGEQNNAE